MRLPTREFRLGPGKAYALMTRHMYAQRVKRQWLKNAAFFQWGIVPVEQPGLARGERTVA